MDMDKDLLSFIIRAKRATYAGKGAEVKSSRLKSHDLTYQEGDLMYYDTYLGGPRFAGEEALWIKGKPVWAMNYCGFVLDEDEFSGDFLKEALLNVPLDKPFRGPNVYIDGDYEYNCKVNGDYEWFQGMETIEYKGLIIYECYFHGGLIK